MGIGGLAARAALLKEQLKKKPCKRCGLHFDPDEETACPHCGHLDEAGLQQLLSKKERERAGNSRLGNRMLLAAIVFFVLLLLIVGK